MSIRMALTVAYLHLNPRATQTTDSLHKAVLARTAAPEPPASVRAIATIENLEIGGFDVIRLTPHSGSTGTQLVYLHGGAYVFPLGSAHWKLIETLVAQTGATVTVPKYGLAPEYRADAAYELLDAIYDRLTGPVFLVGDSAGGGLALGFAMRLRDTGRPAPAGVILISPWLDITMTNPGIAAIAPRDPILAVPGLVEAGRWWAGARDTRDPLVSPALGSVGNLPPLHFYQGGRDILAPDAIAFAKKAGAHLTLYPGAFHGFTRARWTPEAREAILGIQRVITADG